MRELQRGETLLSNTEARQILVDSLQARVSTQNVSAAILGLDVSKSFSEQLVTSLKEVSDESSHGMGEKFAPVDDAKDQLLILGKLFPFVDSIESAKQGDVYKGGYLQLLERVVADLRVWLNLSEGVTAEQALASRLENKNAWTSSSASSKKAYLKRLRAVASFEAKIKRVQQALISRNGLMTAKSRLAREVQADKLNDYALAYVAYVTARANRRTRFQLTTQSKAFDSIADGLFHLLPKDTAWEEIVLVSPVESLLSRLDSEALGVITARFYSDMVFWANQLASEWEKLPEDVQVSGIVCQGTNSTDFNSYAGAYNTMRSAWIASMSVAGLTKTFDNYLPGKAIRLLAGDLVRWNTYEGGSVSLDFDLFQKLPYPWLVVNAQAELNRSLMVEADVLTEDKLISGGWVSTRKNLELEIPEADPALVHGVTVSDPEFAKLLRKIGVFSAKGLNFSALTELVAKV